MVNCNLSDGLVNLFGRVSDVTGKAGDVAKISVLALVGLLKVPGSLLRLAR